MPKLSEVTTDKPRKLKLSEVTASAPPATPAAPEPSYNWGRAAALTGRDVVEGIAGTAGIVTDPFVAGWNALTGRQDPGARAVVGGALDSVGVPRPASGTERVISNINQGAVGAAPFLGLAGLASKAPGVVGSIGETMAARPGLQVASGASGGGAAGITRESGGSPTAQTVAGFAGGFFPGAALYTGAATMRGLARGGEAGRKAMVDGISDFHAVGTNPTVGQATGNRRTQGLESLIAGGPTSSGTMVTAARNQADEIGQGLQDRANALYPNASAERAGGAISRGVDTFTGNVQAQRKALYWQADKLVPDTTVSPLANTRTALADLVTPNPNAPATTGALVNPKIAALAKNIEADLAAGNGLPYSTLKDIRSRIGAELSDFSLSTDKPTAEYKRLYAALSQDMEAAAKSQGPAAEQAAKRANSYFKASAARLETLERVVDKAGGPERVYEAAMAGTRDGATTLRAVMRSLPTDGQKALTAAVVKRMGLPTKGNRGAEAEAEFSAQTFLTNWNGLSKEARNALFAPHQQGNAKFVADMDKIARVAERIKTGSQVFANPAGTANRGLAISYWLGLAGATLTGQAQTAAGLAGGGTLAYGTAKLMTNPAFVGWLARSTSVPVQALPQQIQVLKQIAAREDDEAMAAYANGLENQLKNAPHQ